VQLVLETALVCSSPGSALLVIYAGSHNINSACGFRIF